MAALAPSAQNSRGFIRRGRFLPSRAAIAWTDRLRKGPFFCSGELHLRLPRVPRSPPRLPPGPWALGSLPGRTLVCPWQQRWARRSLGAGSGNREQLPALPNICCPPLQGGGWNGGLWENVRVWWLLPWESSREQLVPRGEEVWELPECPALGWRGFDFPGKLFPN